MQKKAVASLVVIMLFVMALAGCGGKAASTNEATPTAGGKSTSAGASATPAGTPVLDQTPVHLTAMCIGACLEDDLFKKDIADPLNKQYPFLTIELIKDKIDKVMESGEIPDIIISGIQDVSVIKQYQLQTDLTPYIKKYNLDLSAFEPSTLDMVKKYGDHGEIYSMPYRNIFFALYYNKDIFDHFGVSYPKDGMTWQEVIDLAKQMTRSDGGKSYKGLATMSPIARLSLTMLQDKFDEKTQKATLTTDDWVRTMQTVKDIYSIPGNEKVLPAKDFTDKQDIAMFAGSGQLAVWEQLQKAGTPLNWDMVSFPTMPNHKGQVDSPLGLISITSKSKHKDQAFQVIKIATSKEIQLNISKEAMVTVLKDQSIKDAFGQDFETVKGKNIKAPFLNQNMPVNVASRYDDIINKEINTAANDIITDKADINTALRSAEERANAAIATEKQ